MTTHHWILATIALATALAVAGCPELAQIDEGGYAVDDGGGWIIPDAGLADAPAEAQADAEAMDPTRYDTIDPDCWVALVPIDAADGLDAEPVIPDHVAAFPMDRLCKALMDSDVVLEGIATPVVPGTDPGLSLFDLCVALARDASFGRCRIDMDDLDEVNDAALFDRGELDQIDPDLPVLDDPF